MKKGKDIIRVKEDKCNDYLKTGYAYTSKSEWKQIRGSKHESVVETVEGEIIPKAKKGKKSNK
jgi:hypothetical protein